MCPCTEGGVAVPCRARRPMADSLASLSSISDLPARWAAWAQGWNESINIGSAVVVGHIPIMPRRRRVSTGSFHWLGLVCKEGHNRDSSFGIVKHPGCHAAQQVSRSVVRVRLQVPEHLS